MKPFIEDPDLTLYCGDALAVLRELEDESVQTCVTSPPYWGLRDYGVDGQVGLESTPEKFVSTMVEIFREVRRVLRADGTLWLNLGDSYASSSSYNGAQTIATERGWKQDGDHRPNIYARDVGLKAKDLCMVPARVALALQADGWWLRSEIIWAKPNVMPESVTDRPTRAHEQVYLFAKNERYFFDQDAVREPYKFDGRKVNHVEARDGSTQHRDGERWPGAKRRSGNHERVLGSEVGTPDIHRDGMGRGIPWEEDGRGRNVRTVWEIATESSKEAHFAIFPRELARRCVAAGTSERGCCHECGAQWVRVTATESTWAERKAAGAEQGTGWVVGEVRDGRSGSQRTVHGEGLSHDLTPRARVIGGWRPVCRCYDERYAQFPRPRVSKRWQNRTWRARVRKRPIPVSFGWPVVAANVLDPFMGSGTTAHVARAMARHSIGIELNPDYCALIAKRTQQLSLEG